MKIEYNPKKNERNVRERGLSFDRAIDFDFSTALILEDTRQDYGETRYRALGWLHDELHALVFTPRGDTLRIISLRRAHRKERMLYAEASQSRND